jgi:hypothetical protein
VKAHFSDKGCPNPKLLNELRSSSVNWRSAARLACEIEINKAPSSRQEHSLSFLPSCRRLRRQGEASGTLGDLSAEEVIDQHNDAVPFIIVQQCDTSWSASQYTSGLMVQVQAAGMLTAV